ncbi:MAG: hypothetical protein QG673_588 [Pseudomonadota bacterium]|nr:hypothetical protein [Pseudomonadota bacterium]
MQNLFNLNKKIIVVTGGSGLLGSVICRALANYKATVIVADLNQDAGTELAKSICSDGFSAKYLSIDITSKASINELINSVASEYGGIDVWVNNAYPRTSDWGAKLEDIPIESWNKNVEMHLGGYFLCCQQVAQFMRYREYGNIINFASIYGMVGPDFSVYDGTNMTMPAAYSAIKGGIINFTRYLASYYGKYNVRVNSISPGGIFDNQPESFVKNYSKACVLGRMGMAYELCGPLVFLASDSSSYITGHNLVVDGGWTIV